MSLSCSYNACEDKKPAANMILRAIPLLTGLLPILAIHGSLFLAIGAETVPSCNPYLSGCTSISATGRYEPASFLFKPAMIAEAVLMIVYWLFSVAWLKSLHEDAGMPGKAGAWVASTGIIGAIFLIIYVTFLGTQEPIYEFMRRFGVYVYFAGTVIAQLILVTQVLAVCKTGGKDSLQRIAKMQLFLALVPFALGILNLALKAILEDANALENSIEWIFALLVHCYFVLSFCAWRETGFEARCSVTWKRS